MDEATTRNEELKRDVLRLQKELAKVLAQLQDADRTDGRADVCAEEDGPFVLVSYVFGVRLSELPYEFSAEHLDEEQHCRALSECLKEIDSGGGAVAFPKVFSISVVASACPADAEDDGEIAVEGWQSFLPWNQSPENGEPPTPFDDINTIIAGGTPISWMSKETRLDYVQALLDIGTSTSMIAMVLECSERQVRRYKSDLRKRLGAEYLEADSQERMGRLADIYEKSIAGIQESLMSEDLSGVERAKINRMFFDVAQRFENTIRKS